MARSATKAQAERAARIINRKMSTTGCVAFKYEDTYWSVLTDVGAVDAVDASYALGDAIPGVYGEPVNNGLLTLIVTAH